MDTDNRPVSHPTKLALLETGLALAEGSSLASTSVDQLVRAAGVSKGTFYVHFPDRASYLVALHHSFHAVLGSQILAALGDRDPGATRLRVGAEAYLDGCLGLRGVKAMLLDVRSEPLMASDIRTNTETFTQQVAEDYEALGLADPVSAARLFIAMVQEVAMTELETGHPVPSARKALWRLGLGGSHPEGH